MLANPRSMPKYSVGVTRVHHAHASSALCSLALTFAASNSSALAAVPYGWGTAFADWTAVGFGRDSQVGMSAGESLIGAVG